MKYLVAIGFFVVIGIISLVLVLHFRKVESKDVLTLYGNVDVRQVDISFRVGGRVNALSFEEGDYVPEGALMATIEQEPYLDKVEESLAHIKSLQAALVNANEILKRREALVEEGAVSQEDYQNALCARDICESNLKKGEASYRVALKNLEDTQVKSPSAGVILTRIREVGSVVRETDPVYTLSLNSPVWVRAFVSEPELGDIYFGMQADIFTDTKDTPVYKGAIGFISPVAEFTPKTVQTVDLRTDLVYRLRIIVDNPDWSLKQGMPVTVKLYLKRKGSNEYRRDLHPKSQ